MIELSSGVNVLNFIYEESENEIDSTEGVEWLVKKRTGKNITDLDTNLQSNTNTLLCSNTSLKKLAFYGIYLDSQSSLHTNNNIWSKSFKSNYLTLQAGTELKYNVEHLDYNDISGLPLGCEKVHSINFDINLSNNTMNYIPKGSRFFVIKSFTEEDILQSYHHGIWASTKLGNRRLSNAYKQLKHDGNIYLFFLINSSGRFCGIAVMKGDIDYTKESDIWSEKSRWKGIFPIEWISIKDIPNKYLYHLKIISNENKPITNSRDTQEVPYEVAIQMMNIFQTTQSNTSFLQKYIK